MGSHYESRGGVITKYYLAGGTRLAMRKGSTSFYWLLSDHLGSTSKVATSTGALHSQQLYKAWGESRYTSGTLPTRYTYTGQYSYAGDFGLVFYGSRFYDPLLARWASPDSIIPHNQGTQAWDRYAYVNNSPVNYTNPTGHFLESFLDIASIAYDIYDISQNGLNWGSGLSLAADVASLILPGVTGGGMAVRALSKVDDVGDAARAVNTASNLAQTGNQAQNATQATSQVQNTTAFLDDVASRAVRHNPGSGPVIGTQRHSYASRMIDRFQNMYGPIGGGLSTEVTYAPGFASGRAPYGTSGSVRLDVVEGNLQNPLAVYDFKSGGAVLSNSRKNQILNIAGFPQNTPIIPIQMK